jgi:methylthioribose-1-phosphate isomerase
VLAKTYGIPLYVAAPTSTIDMSLQSGDVIPIEQREVTHLAGQILAPEGVEAAHPAFDVTPHTLISAIITEKGIVEPPLEENLCRITREPQTDGTTQHVEG